MLAGLEVSEHDRPIAAAGGKLPPTQASPERLHCPLMGFTYVQALSLENIPHAQRTFRRLLGRLRKPSPLQSFVLDEFRTML